MHVFHHVYLDQPTTWCYFEFCRCGRLARKLVAEEHCGSPVGRNSCISFKNAITAGTHRGYDDGVRAPSVFYQPQFVVPSPKRTLYLLIGWMVISGKKVKLGMQAHAVAVKKSLRLSLTREDCVAASIFYTLSLGSIDCPQNTSRSCLNFLYNGTLHAIVRLCKKSNTKTVP